MIECSNDFYAGIKGIRASGGCVTGLRCLKMPLALAISDSGNNPNLCLAGLWFVCLTYLVLVTVGGIAIVGILRL